jgi:hypothetical protein
MSPIFFVTFFLLTQVFPGYAFLTSAVIFFTAGINALEGISGRYAFTHNLAWSLKSRPILALMCATISVLLVILARF